MRQFKNNIFKTRSEDEVTPPIVLAGDDVFITDTQTTASLLATAYDPDGFIVSQNWTKLVGSFGDVIVSPNQLATELQNLTDDFYTYKIEVIDNGGASAFDVVNVYRVKSYDVALILVAETGNPNTVGRADHYRKYRLQVSPTLLGVIAIRFTGSIGYISNGLNASGYCYIYKNGSKIADIVGTENLVMNFIATDEVYFEFFAAASYEEFTGGSTAQSFVNITQAEFINGNGIVTNLPLFGGVSVSVYS